MQFILSLVMLASTGTSDVTPLRWLSPDNSKPLSFAQWHSGLQPQAWHVRTLVPATRFSNRVDFFVQEALASALQPSLDTLAVDLSHETTDVAVFSVNGNLPNRSRPCSPPSTKAE